MSDLEDAEAVLRDIDLPGNGEALEARIEAVLLVYEYLQMHEGEPVAAGELYDLVAQSHLMDDVEFKNIWSFWTQIVRANTGRPNALKSLPGVREVPGPNGKYIYEEEE